MIRPTRLQTVSAVAAAWGASAILQAALGRQLGAALGLTVCVATIAALVAAAGPLRCRGATHGAVGATVVGLVGSSWLGGGVDATSWFYLACVPPFAMYHLGRGEGRVWTGLVVVAALLATGNPLGLPTEAPPPAWARVAGGLGVIAVVAWFASLARSLADSHLEDASKAANTRVAAISGLAHELRSPLHGILGGAVVLGETELNPGQRALIDGLRANGAGLLRLVNDLLDTARIDAGLVDLVEEPTDVLSVLEDVIDGHALVARTRGLALTLLHEGLDDVPLLVDGQRVRQIVTNLVDNAVKFTDVGGVTVRATASRAGSRVALSLCVEDTGPGIGDETLRNLFQPFASRPERSDRGKRGTGLGLWLSRQLAVRMGGDLQVDSTPGRGSRFELRITVTAGEAQSPPMASDRFWLVVEADPASGAAMHAALRSALVPHEVVTGVEAATRSLGRRVADVVVIAWSPELDPNETLGELRPLLRGARTVVAVPPDQIVGASTRFPEFHQVTLRALRRSRIRELSVPPVEAAREHAGMQAVIVDDDALNRAMLALVLERRGVQVHVFEDAARARDWLAAGAAPDLVFSDLYMRPMDGLEFARQVRTFDRTVRLVAVTASVAAHDTSACRAAGFDAVMHKPFTFAAVEEQLALARAGAGTEVLIDEARWAQTAAFLGGSLDDTLAEFARTAGAGICAILEHPEQIDAVRLAAHRLAGSAALLGYRSLFLAARALELQEPPPDPEAVRAAAQHLDHLLRSSMDRLALLRGGITSPPNPDRAAMPVPVPRPANLRDGSLAGDPTGGAGGSNPSTPGKGQGG